MVLGTIVVPYTYYKNNFPNDAYNTRDLGSLGVACRNRCHELLVCGDDGWVRGGLLPQLGGYFLLCLSGVVIDVCVRDGSGCCQR